VREEIDHVPFKINPLGMQPVLVAVFLCEGAMWLVNALSDNGTKWPEWALHVAACAFSSASGSVAYYVIFFATVFGFSYLDLQNTPKEVAEYMTKIGARVPNVRPGEQTAAHLEELQRGSRFFGGLLLAIVATGVRVRGRAHAANHRDLRRVHVHAHRDVHHHADETADERHGADAEVGQGDGRALT
jgi:preprotein translocase subunit SecY